VQFQPVEPALVPAAVEELCLAYNRSIDQIKIARLVTVACVVFYFLCMSFPPLVGQFLIPNKLVNRSSEICSPWLLLSRRWGEERCWCKADRSV
jgi:hypothetical protein